MNILETKYKECNLVVPSSLVHPIQEYISVNLSNWSMQWLYIMVELCNALRSANCYAVVDRLFFLENSEIISAYWIFTIDYRIIDRRGFVAYTSKNI